MRYSLLSRFHGVLLGATLGEELGFYQQSIQTLITKKSLADCGSESTSDCLVGWRPGAERLANSNAESEFVAWGKIAVTMANTLIHQQDWQNATLRATVAKAMNGYSEVWSRLTSEPSNISGGLAIATLPIALFFHDNQKTLEQVLGQVVEDLSVYPDSFTQLLVVHYAITLALREQLFPSDLIPQIVAYLEENVVHLTAAANFVGRLKQIQQLVQEGADLRTATLTLFPSKETTTGAEAVELALYCFLSTPDDFSVAMLRAARSCDSPQIVCALTGALLGAYNGTMAIPLNWRLNIDMPSHILSWGLSNKSLNQLGVQLLATWSGVYDSMGFEARTLAVGAPGVIRPC